LVAPALKGNFYMSLRIEIILPDPDVSRTNLADHMAALGFASSTSAVAIAAAAPKSEPVTVTGDTEVQSGGTKPRASRKKAETGQISSSPENRVGPEDDAETQDQDKADEAAEVEQSREPEKPLTIDDVKAAVGAYVSKFDMAAAQQDGPQLFVDLLGKPPEGEAYWKMSMLPTDQESLKKVVDGWTKAAAASKRYGA